MRERRCLPFILFLIMDKEYKKIKQWYTKNTEQYTKKSAILLYSQLKYFISLIPKNGRILDIGCGPGHDTEYFAKHGFQSIGIDFSSGMIKYAKKNRPAGLFKQIDLLEVDKYFPKNYFDGIWASSSITHLNKKDISKSLGQIKKVVLHQRPIIFFVKAKTKQRRIKKEIIFNEFYKKDIINYIKKSKLQIKKIEVFTILNSRWLFIHAQKNYL